MCYQVINQTQIPHTTSWLCCSCRMYTNKLDDMTCKGCGHARCAAFGEDGNKNITIIDARSAYPAYINPKHTGKSDCQICKGMPKHTRCLYLKREQTMNHITLEELLSLLTQVPPNATFQLGTPPEGAERTLSIQVYCQLSKEDSERVHRVAQSLNATRESPCCIVGPKKEDPPEEQGTIKEL